MKPADWIGWVSSLILLATLTRQIWTQWQSRATSGVSRWLFVGQLVASTGFAVYSWLLHNWVFLLTNVALAITAIAGECMVLLHSKRRANRK
jgi:MtN3 and saliva related transmembrane protein